MGEAALLPGVGLVASVSQLPGSLSRARLWWKCLRFLLVGKLMGIRRRHPSVNLQLPFGSI
jgi:hypothetical protein